MPCTTKTDYNVQVHAEDGSSADQYTAEFGYFGSLTIENVRCFAGPQTLELRIGDKPAKWTVILGDNGVGKTTLLRCLHALEPVPATGYDNLVCSRPRASLWPTKTRPTFYAGVARDRTQRSHLSAQFCVDTRLAGASERWLSYSISAEGRSLTAGMGFTGFWFTAANGVALDLFACGYGAGRKPGASAFIAEEEEQQDNASTLFDDNARLRAADEWLLQFDYAAKSTKTPEAILRSDRVKQTLIRLLPDVEDLRVAGLDLQPPVPAVEAKTPYGWVRVRDLSLGYRTLMAWVVDFAARLFARYPDAEDPLAEPAVCLVDEIDLHLHPTWQRGLITYLDELFPQTQFIVTAHSPLVVQAAENAKIAVLERHEGDDFVTIHNDLEAVRGWRVDQILTSDLFGLDGSRSPRVNKLLSDRAQLLRKPELDDDDRQQLAEFDAQLGQIPLGDTAEDRSAWEVIRKFAGGISNGSIAK